MKNTPLHSSPAHLWDGANRLPGALELWEREIVFRPEYFASGHLLLVIPLAEIERVEEFLVFDVARNGLRISSFGGRSDLFVMDQGQSFKHAVYKQLQRS
jgi:hypothetical protein